MSRYLAGDVIDMTWSPYADEPLWKDFDGRQPQWTLDERLDVAQLVERARQGKVEAERPWPTERVGDSNVRHGYVFFAAALSSDADLRRAMQTIDVGKRELWDKRLDDLRRPRRRKRHPVQDIIEGALAWCDLLIAQLQRHIEELKAAEA